MLKLYFRAHPDTPDNSCNRLFHHPLSSLSQRTDSVVAKTMASIPKQTHHSLGLFLVVAGCNCVFDRNPPKPALPTTVSTAPTSIIPLYIETSSLLETADFSAFSLRATRGRSKHFAHGLMFGGAKIRQSPRHAQDLALYVSCAMGGFDRSRVALTRG